MAEHPYVQRERWGAARRRSLRFLGAGAMLTAAIVARPAAAQSVVDHSYTTTLGTEVVNLIPVPVSKLIPLVPNGYSVVPAAALGVGTSDQGVVVITNYRGLEPSVDDRRLPQDSHVAINVAILVAEPGEAVAAGVSIFGAYHFYTLSIYTDNALYAGVLRQADFPVEYVGAITYQRTIDDTSGVGALAVNVPSRDSPLYSFNDALGYSPAQGALDAVFWHNGRRGTAILHFHEPSFRDGAAVSQIYTEPQSAWDSLFNGGGFGACAADPATEYDCVEAGSRNFRYDGGSRGRLLLITN
jgi:hypothetical protein